MYKLFIMLLSLLFSPSATHICVYVCMYVSVLVCGCVCEFWWLSTTQSLEELQDYFFFIFSTFDFYFAFDFTGRFQLVDWESKTFFFSVFVVSISSEFVALLECLLLLLCCCCCFLLPVCILDVRDGHSQELLLLVNVNEMSNVLQSPSEKWPHDIFKLEILTIAKELRDPTDNGIKITFSLYNWLNFYWYFRRKYIYLSK